MSRSERERRTQEDAVRSIDQMNAIIAESTGFLDRYGSSKEEVHKLYRFIALEFDRFIALIPEAKRQDFTNIRASYFLPSHSERIALIDAAIASIKDENFHLFEDLLADVQRLAGFGKREEEARDLEHYHYFRIGRTLDPRYRWDRFLVEYMIDANEERQFFQDFKKRKRELLALLPEEARASFTFSSKDRTELLREVREFFEQVVLGLEGKQYKDYHKLVLFLDGCGVRYLEVFDIEAFLPINFKDRPGKTQPLAGDAWSDSNEFYAKRDANGDLR